MDFNKFILGSQKVETEDQERKVLLGGYLILFYFLVDAFYFVVSLFNPQGIPWILISGAVVSLISFGLLRNRHTNWAIFVYLVRANYIIYFFSSQEGLETGTFIFFLSYGITPLAFYGYTDRWKGITYALVSYFLFLITKFQPGNFRPDQANFYFIINYTVVGVTLAFIILFFDRMSKEAVLKIDKQNKDLVKANDELDKFVYSASHDLRSPLASVLGLVKIYELAISADERDKIIEMIKARAMKMDDFIAKILDYSQNTRKEIKIEPVHLKSAVVASIQSLQYHPGFDKVHFEIEISEDQTVLADAERIKIILTNLISNTIRYRDDKKGKAWVGISSRVDKAKVLIFIKDIGVGIEKEHLPRIFEMFYRAHSFSDGSGIGLYIVKESLLKMSGEISVESEFGKGSTFTVSLPQLEK